MPPGLAAASPVLVIDRSADGGITAVVAVALLFAGSVSVAMVATVAVLLMRVRSRVSEWNLEGGHDRSSRPAGIVPSAQGNVVVQSPLLPTNVNPLVVVSVTVTTVASRGPLLRTKIV